MPAQLTVHEHFASNNDGWVLHLRQVFHPERLRPELHPVVIVPGYGMNSFIFGFHPRGTSMEKAFADAGLEVWSVNLRAQGASRATKSNPPPPSLRGFAEMDLFSALEAVAAKTRTRQSTASVIGCSLGGSIAYALLALHPDHRVHALVTIGSPLRWVDVPLPFELAFKHPRLIGLVRPRGTRRLAHAAFPLIEKLPWVIRPYMNPAHVDLAAAGDLTRTIEDPHPKVNRDIAHWIHERDMLLRGVNVTEALRSASLPLMIVLANRDGIVPEANALAAAEAWGGPDIEMLRVGTDDDWYAHADLFVGNEAPAKVFKPLSDWLVRKSVGASLA